MFVLKKHKQKYTHFNDTFPKVYLVCIFFKLYADLDIRILQL